MQLRSGRSQHSELFASINTALNISLPLIDVSHIGSSFLSVTEIELFLLLAQEYLYLNQPDICLTICTKINIYLSNSNISFFEKEQLLAFHATVYAKYLLAIEDYSNALKLSENFRHKMAVRQNEIYLHELTFLSAPGYYYTNQYDNFLSLFKCVFVSAHSIDSCYATICYQYVTKHLAISLPEDFALFPEIPLTHFSQKKIPSSLSADVTYNSSSTDTLTIGSLIRLLRTEQNISQSSLCVGLCSKSKLSKIETDALQPNLILTQSLLQRLGISDRVLTFYSNADETKLQELLTQATSTTDKLQTMQCIQNIETLCSSKDRQYLQFTLFERACLETDINKKIKAYQEALSLTLPGFDFHAILNYRLSWLELNILNSLCCAYAHRDSVQGLFYFYKLYEYYTCIPIDILELKRTFPTAVALFIHHLYRQKRFSEIKTFLPAVTLCKNSLYCTGNIYANYCHVLGKSGQLHDATYYSYYAFYNFTITELHENASAVKNDVYYDFKIVIS